jgi:hypothetical protein
VAKDDEWLPPSPNKPWTMPPLPEAPKDLPPLPPPPGPRSGQPVSDRAAEPPAKVPLTFEDFASRMGREVVKVGPLFRIGAVLIICGALILVAENALIFTSTVGQIQTAQQAFNNPGNNTSAQGTGNTLSNMQGYFAMLSVATSLDILGFSALGGGAILMGLGSQFIVFRNRFDGEEKRPSKSIMILALISGACAFLWVFYTTTWRTQLTGSPTGDWSWVPPMFDVGSWVNNRGIPQSVRDFSATFPRAGPSWMIAAGMQIPAAAFFFLAGWRLKKETGIRFGGTSWLVWSFTNLIGTIVFVIATIGALEQTSSIDFSSPDSWSSSIAGIALQLGIAAGTKLFFIPLWAIISFAILSISGIKMLRITSGKALMSDKILKDILKAEAAPAPPPPPDGGVWPLGSPAPPPPPAPGGGASAMATSLPQPRTGEDVFVSVPGGPPQGPLK